jgi:hypothetical protein
MKIKYLLATGVFFMFLPAVVNCTQAALLTYGFDDGTIASNGWTEVSNNSVNQACFNVVYGGTLGNLTPQAGAGLVAELGNLIDSPGSTLWIRSPEFKLNGGTDDLSVYLMGGSGEGADATGKLVANVPAQQFNDPLNTTFPSFLGIALRNVNTGVFVLAGHRSSNVWGSWERVAFTAAQLAALDQNATYTLDLIDARAGSWGWVNMDSVSIPGTEVIPEPTDVSWNGSASNNWAAIANWTGGLPSSTHALNAIINPGSPNVDPAISTLGNTTKGQVYVSINAALNITAGGQLSVATDLVSGVWGDSRPITVSGGTLTMGGYLNLGPVAPYVGTISITGGTVTAVHLSLGNPNAKMDISGNGAFILTTNTTDQLNAVNYWINANMITAYGGAGTINVDTTTDPTKIILTTAAVSSEVEAGTGFITWIGEPVLLDASVSGGASPTLTWTYSPMDGKVTFSNASVEDPTVTFAATGTYTLTLSTNYGFHDTTTVHVYANACLAARDGMKNRPATDLVADCIIDLKDLAEIAENWMEDYALTAPAAKAEMRIPRVSKSWSESFRLVGGQYPLYSDFSLTKDALGQWHCIGTFGESPATIGSGYELSDGYTLFHAVGSSLEAPMTHLAKIPYQIASEQAYMWAPGVTWNRDHTRAFLYYFHFFGSYSPLYAQSACRLLISDSPDLSAWRPYDGTELSETNMVFREEVDRDFRVFWDDRLGEYLMYYCAAAGLRVRTSTDLLHWSEPVTVLKDSTGSPHGYSESPFVLYRDGYYYLWTSGIDYSHTHLFISEDPFNFGDVVANTIEEQPGHAPEIVSDNGQDYMACSMVSTVPSAFPAAYDLEGILIQPLRWDKPDAGMETRVTRKP